MTYITECIAVYAKASAHACLGLCCSHNLLKDYKYIADLRTTDISDHEITNSHETYSEVSRIDN